MKAFAAYRLARVPFVGMPRHIVESIRRCHVREPPSVDVPGVAFRAMADVAALAAIRAGGRGHGRLGGG